MKYNAPFFRCGLLVGVFCVYGQLMAQPANTIIRPAIKKLAEQMAADNVLKSEGVGFAGTRTEQWGRFEQMKKEATTSELLLLADDRNGVVRAYAFHALSLRSDADLLPVVIKHLYDTERIQVFSGCIMSAEAVGDYMLDVVTPKLMDLDANKITGSRRRVIDSILIFDKRIRLYSVSTALEHLKPEKRYYVRLKEMLVKEHRTEAIIPISRYHKPEDIPIISALLKDNNAHDNNWGLSSVYYGLWAVRNFPNPAFFNELKAIQAASFKSPAEYDAPVVRMLYQAIVQYKDRPSRRLLESALGRKGEEHFGQIREDIWIALMKYKSPAYKGILERIRLSEAEKQEYMWSVDSDS